MSCKGRQRGPGDGLTAALPPATLKTPSLTKPKWSRHQFVKLGISGFEFHRWDCAPL